MMKVNVVSRKLIKPCTPTPQNLNKYKISFKDELSPPMNVGVLLFYPSKPKLVSHLEESLAEILSQFYPLAGRYIKKDYFADCSDQGAEFVEAEAVDVELIDLVEKTKTIVQLNDLLPRQSDHVDEPTDPLLSIQVTEFKCGGLVISVSVSVSHRIFDASSIGTFIAAWSNANSNPGGKITIIPSFDSASLFPGKNMSYYPDFEPSESGEYPSNIVVKRFLFNKEAIMRVRSKLKPKDRNSSRGISRVRVVCSIIAKALIGVDRAKYGQPRDCVISQAVNKRGRTIPPLPKHSCGNLVIQSVTQLSMAATETQDMGIQELVYLLGDAIDKTVFDCAEILSLGEDGQKNIIINPEVKLIESSENTGEVNVLWFSDWSKFGFYEVDFGWGKPVWTSIGPLPGENLTGLMDNKEGGGIESWVHLNQNDMPYFEQDEEIRMFTT